MSAQIARGVVSKCHSTSNQRALSAAKPLVVRMSMLHTNQLMHRFHCESPHFPRSMVKRCLSVVDHHHHPSSRNSRATKKDSLSKGHEPLVFFENPSPIINKTSTTRDATSPHSTDSDTERARSILEAQEKWLLAQLADEDTARTVQREDFAVILRQLAILSPSIPGCAVRAERWLGRLERWAASGIVQDIHKEPDAECYRLVIQAWANSTREDSNLIVNRAERWLMKHLHSPLEFQRPDTYSFNAFLDAISRGRAYKESRSGKSVQQHAEKAQKTLQMMIDDRMTFGSASRIAPNTDSFNYVIRAWTRCRKADGIADFAVDALRSLEDFQRDVDPDVRPDSKSFGMVLDSLSCRAAQKARACAFLRKKEHANEDIDPHDSSENGLDEIEMIESIIELMHQRGGILKPTTPIYNILISAWANISRFYGQLGPPSAERVLQRMTRYDDQGSEQIKPDAYSYLLVMRAWSYTRLPNRADRVAWWLGTQWKDYEFDGDPDRQPTTACYNVVIRLYAEKGNPEKAEEYLKQMGEKGVRPNSESILFVMKAWLTVVEREGDFRALRKAADWLGYAIQCEEQGIPSIKLPHESFGNILAAARKCAPTSPQQTLELALEVFGKMKHSHHAVDCLEYIRLLQVGILSLSRSEDNARRTKFIKDLFKDCAEAGLVSCQLVRTISNGAIYYDGWTVEKSKEMTTELFGEWPFPSWWSRNVKQDGYLPKQSDLTRTYFYETASHSVDPFKRRRSKSPQFDDEDIRQPRDVM